MWYSRGFCDDLVGKKTCDSTVMTLIFTCRLIPTQPADTLTEINSHVAAEHFAAWNWIVLLSDKGRKNSVWCRSCKHLQRWSHRPLWLFLFFLFFLQNEIPPYESRITTAKLLIESEEYEVMCLQCVVLVRSVLAGLCVVRGRRAAWHFFMCVCMRAFLSAE